MRLIPGYLAPSITESWLRRYQVLPGRMHPMMNASGSGGFILHAIKVYGCSVSLGHTTANVESWFHKLRRPERYSGYIPAKIEKGPRKCRVTIRTSFSYAGGLNGMCRHRL